MAQVGGRVIIYGGRGALGSKCVSFFKLNNWWVGSIDLSENAEADLNVVVGRDEDLVQQESNVLCSVSSALSGQKLDAVICVAGGWSGGNSRKELAKTFDTMWKQSVWTSIISSSVAAYYLKEGGLISLTGAKAALDPTPESHRFTGMIGYGVAKAAVHNLVHSLAADDSGLPKDTVAVAILPITLDTPMNRKWMPKADFSKWTPLEYVAELFFKWSNGKDRPANGSLVQLITTNYETQAIPV